MRVSSTVLTVIFLFGFQFSFAVEITYWPPQGVEDVELAKILVNEWNGHHPEIRVKMQPIPAAMSSEEVLIAAIVSKTTPDICSNILPAMMGRFTKSKAVLPLDMFEDYEKVIYSRMSPSTVDMFRSKDGRLYQVPWKSNPIMLVYNKKLFSGLNLSPPKTYSEFMDVARALTKDLDGDGITDRWAMSVSIKAVWWNRLFDFYPFYIAATNGAMLLKENRTIFNNDGAVAAMSFFREGFKKGFFPMLGFSGNIFLQGKVGMIISGSWIMKYYERVAPEFEYDFSQIPVPDDHEGPVYTYGDPKNIVIFSTTKHPNESWEFVKFLISKEADLKLLEITNQSPLRSKISEDPYFADFFMRNPLLKKVAKQAEHVTSIDQSIHIVQILDIISRQYEACAVYGIIPPKESIEQAAKKVQAIYDYW